MIEAMILGLGGKRLVTVTFPAGTTNYTVPAGVTVLNTASGYGARGTDEYTYTDWTYEYVYFDVTYYYDENHVMTNYFILRQGREFGPTPSSYCLPENYQPGMPSPYNQRCFEYTDVSTSQEVTKPTSTGKSTTGFGKTFPGSYGNTQQSTTTFTDVAVTPNQQYSVVVPTGGTLTITFLA